MRKLLTLRWLTAAAMIVVLAIVCFELGEWQLSRLDERRDLNEITRSNLAATPAPVLEIVGAQKLVGEAHDWRTATATGVYDESRQLVIRYRNVSNRRGFEIVTPLRLADGSVLLVDRGFLARGNNSSEVPPIPAAPAGQVTVTGRLRRSERGGDTKGVVPVDGSARLINAPAIAKATGQQLIDGYLLADSQQPAADPAFRQLPAPEIDSGPHFFYALQWFLFALLALGGLVYFTRRDVRGDGKSEPGPAGSGSPAVGSVGPGASETGAPEAVAAATADRGLRPDRGHADGGPGRD